MKREKYIEADMRAILPTITITAEFRSSPLAVANTAVGLEF